MAPAARLRPPKIEDSSAVDRQAGAIETGALKSMDRPLTVGLVERLLAWLLPVKERTAAVGLGRRQLTVIAFFLLLMSTCTAPPRLQPPSERHPRCAPSPVPLRPPPPYQVHGLLRLLGRAGRAGAAATPAPPPPRRHLATTSPPPRRHLAAIEPYPVPLPQDEFFEEEQKRQIVRKSFDYLKAPPPPPRAPSPPPPRRRRAGPRPPHRPGLHLYLSPPLLITTGGALPFTPRQPRGHPKLTLARRLLIVAQDSPTPNVAEAAKVLIHQLSGQTHRVVLLVLSGLRYDALGVEGAGVSALRDWREETAADSFLCKAHVRHLSHPSCAPRTLGRGGERRDEVARARLACRAPA